MEKVLLFQTDEQTAGAVRKILLSMKVRCECVSPHMFTKSVAELAQGESAVTISDASPKTETDAACEASQRTEADAACDASQKTETDAACEASQRTEADAACDANQKTEADAACDADREGGSGTTFADNRMFPFRESLMLFCNVSEKHFDRILSLLKQKAIRIDYKAVLTPINGQWNVLRLYAELARERAYYESLAIRGND